MHRSIFMLISSAIVQHSCVYIYYELHMLQRHILPVHVNICIDYVTSVPAFQPRHISSGGTEPSVIAALTRCACPPSLEQIVGT
jgi:hypothetical protein